MTTSMHRLAVVSFSSSTPSKGKIESKMQTSKSMIARRPKTMIPSVWRRTTSEKKQRERRRGQLQIANVGSTYGRFFRVTTFGESHGGGVGCVVDGGTAKAANIEGGFTVRAGPTSTGAVENYDAEERGRFVRDFEWGWIGRRDPWNADCGAREE